MRRAGDVERAVRVDVAEADGRLGRRDADRRDEAGPGDRDGLLDRTAEAPGVADDVVGREGADDDAGLPQLEHRGGKADRRGRVPRLRLEEHVRVDQVRQLLLDRGAVGASGHDDDAVRTDERDDAVPGVAEQAVTRAGQVVEELGGVRAGQRPEPGADPASRDDRREAGDDTARNHGRQPSRPTRGDPLSCRPDRAGYLEWKAWQRNRPEP